MDKVEQLKQQIQELEESVDESWSKEDLYDVLVQAYYHSKDIIQIIEARVELIDDSVAIKEAETQDHITELNNMLASAVKASADATAEKEAAQQQLNEVLELNKTHVEHLVELEAKLGNISAIIHGEIPTSWE